MEKPNLLKVKVHVTKVSFVGVTHEPFRTTTLQMGGKQDIYFFVVIVALYNLESYQQRLHVLPSQ